MPRARCGVCRMLQRSASHHVELFHSPILLWPPNLASSVGWGSVQGGYEVGRETEPCVLSLSKALPRARLILDGRVGRSSPRCLPLPAAREHQGQAVAVGNQRQLWCPSSVHRTTDQLPAWRTTPELCGGFLFFKREVISWSS